MALGFALRKAGPALANFLKGDMTTGQLFRNRLLLDAGVAGVQGLTTPGGLDDKLIAGGTDFVFGAGSGLFAGGLARKLGFNKGIQQNADMLASFAGGYTSYPVGIELTRAADKLTGGPGLTDFEKMAQKDQEQLIASIQEQTLANAGLIPGLSPAYYSSGNDYLAQLGIG